jgi:hypothetical protein
MEYSLADRVRDVGDVDAEAFDQQVHDDAEVVKQLLRDGAFDNHRSIVGLEYEFYAAADGRWSENEATDGALMRVPRRLFDLIDFEKELGLHNAEMTTSPQPFNSYGLAAQEAEVRSRLENARDCTKAEGMRLVSDGIWTIPPAGETAREYLTDSVDDEGVRIAANMSDAVRYHAMANGGQMEKPLTVEAPNVDIEADTVMPESLITSIQPHYQMSFAADLPHYHSYALRVAGPLLALGVNAPFFPPDLYEAGVDAETILEEAWMEHRIAVFESVLNAGDAEKVTFPEDVETVEAAIDRIADDDVVVPMPIDDDSGRFDDQFAAFRTKHGTYWRWVRPVFGGPSCGSANARLEFRPIPGQPTVSGSVAFLAAFAGLMEELPRRGHPVEELSWEQAETNFYTAVREGLDADLEWVTEDGVTHDTDELYDDLLSSAAAGLQSAGCSETEAEKYLAPLRVRVENRVTPASWKVDRVRERLADGATFDEAVTETKREYLRRQADTFLEGQFADWF